MGSSANKSPLPSLFYDLLTAFESEIASKSAAKFLATLPASTKNGFIASLRKPPPGIRPVSLLRALWSSPELRTRCILAVAELGCRSTRECVDDALVVDRQLLDEVGLLLADDARDQSKTPDQRLYVLSQRTADICRRARRNSSPFDIPLLVSCARTAATIASSAAFETCSRIIWFLLLFMRSSVDQGLLSVLAVTAVLDGELKLAAPQHTMLQDVLDSFVTTAHCTDTCFIPLARATLSYMATVTSAEQASRVAYVVLHIFHQAPPSIISDLLVVLEVFAHDHPSALPSLIHAISAVAHASSSHPIYIANRKVFIEPVHLVLLFALLNINISDENRILLQEVVESCLIEDISIDSSQVPSSSTSVGTTCDGWRRLALIECAQHPAMRTRCNFLLRFFESMMWASPVLREWAVFMLKEIFLNIPDSRESILRKIFQSLAEEDASPDVINGFCGLFEQLASETRSTFSLAQCDRTLNDALKTISFLPTAIASRITPVFVSTAVSLPSLFDSVLMFLRKVSAFRDQHHQHVACAGLVAVLGQTRVSDTVTEETSRLLATLLDVAQPSVSSFLVLRLLELTNEPNFSFHRVKILSSRIAERLCLTDELDSRNKRPLRMHEFFTFEDEQFVLRDPIPLLLHFCAMIHQKCSLSNMVYHNYVSYLGDENRALVDACLTNNCEVPVFARISLLCSLLQIVILSHASDSLSSSDMSSNFLPVYGVSLILRDFLLSKEGSAVTKGCNSTWGLIISDYGWSHRGGAVTAREKASARNKCLNSEVQHSSMIPIEFIARALKLVDAQQDGLLSQVVRSELLDMARHDLSRLKTGLSSKGDQRRALYDQFVTSIKTAFIQTCPWIEDVDVESDESGSHFKEVQAISDKFQTELQTNSRSTELTVSDSSSCSKGLVCSPMENVSFIKKLKLYNAKVEKALHENRFGKLSDSARISVRESCLKIMVVFIADGVIFNLWRFVFSVCTKCLHQANRSQPSWGHVNQSNDLNTSSALEEDESVNAVDALTRLFRAEFASSMSVGLTATYLELMYLLLTRSDTSTTNMRVMKHAVSSTLMDTLREYSVQHVGLMRQMVRVLLKAFEEKEAVHFGVRVLEWLGNHVALIDSKYSGIDAVKTTRIGVHEFDEDIIEEAWRIEQGIDDDYEEPDAAGHHSVEANDAHDELDNRDITDINNRAGCTRQTDYEDNEDEDTCPRSSFSSDAVKLDPIRSLCLNETGDGAVASICCVFAYFVDVVQGTCRQLRLRLRNKHVGVSPYIERLNQVVQGVSMFLQGEFVTGCVAGILNDEIEVGESSISQSSVTIRRRKRRRRLKWPTDMQRRILSVFLALMDVVDTQLKILLCDMDSIIFEDNSKAETMLNKSDEKSTSQIAVSCAKAIRLLFEEGNAVTIMGSLQEEGSKQWVVEERFENEASTFVTCWEQISTRKHANTSRKFPGHGKDNASGQKDNYRNQAARDIDSLAKLARRLCSGQLSVSKRKRIERWSRYSTSISGHDNESFNDEEGEVRAMRMNKKQRLRSRNGYIDQYMFEDREQESYVDLENFVVTMNEQLI